MLPKKHKKKRKKEKSQITETSPAKEQEMSRENEEKATETTSLEAMDEKSEAVTEPKSVQSTTRSFRRVTDEEWLGKKGAWDNSYEATFGSSGWGAKAQQVLGSTLTFTPYRYVTCIVQPMFAGGIFATRRRRKREARISAARFQRTLSIPSSLRVMRIRRKGGVTCVTL